MRLSYEEQVRGRTVIDASGRSVGAVDALYLDSVTGGGVRVSGLRVKLHSEIADELGVERGTFRAGVVDVPADALQAVGDAVVLNVAIGTLVHHAPLPGEPAPVH